MKLHPSAHKHVGDPGKPGQIVNDIPMLNIDDGSARKPTVKFPLPMYHAVNPAAPPSKVQLVRDLMYRHRISPFTGKQAAAKTLKDTL